MTKRTFLATEIESQIAWFDRESTKHKKMHRRFRMAVFALTALTSFLAGLPVVFPQAQLPVSLLLLGITAALTVVNSLEGLRKASELWILERTVLYQLHDLRRDLIFYSEDPDPPPAVLDGIYADLQEVLQSSRDHWKRLTGSRTSACERYAPPDLKGDSSGGNGSAKGDA